MSSVLCFLRNRRDPDRVLRLQGGSGYDHLAELCARFGEGGPVGLSINDLHVIYTALVVVWNFFVSEENFYLKVDFFQGEYCCPGW